MAQIGLKYLFYHAFLGFDVVLYLVAIVDYFHLTPAFISLTEQQWKWALFLSIVTAVFRVANFFLQQAIKQREIDEKRLNNEKLEQEIRAMKLENDKKEIENEKLRNG